MQEIEASVIVNAGCRRSAVVSALTLINVVSRHWTRLLLAGEPSRHVTSHLGQSNTACLAGVKAGCVHLCRVEGNTG